MNQMIRNEYDEIVISDKLRSVLQTLTGLKEIYENAKERQIHSEKATQDVLHTFELYNMDSAARNKLTRRLSEIRRVRRIAKNEEAILQPYVQWFRQNESMLDDLQHLLETMEVAESQVNGPKVYYVKTEVVEEALGPNHNVVLDQQDIKVNMGIHKTDETDSDGVRVRYSYTNYDGNMEHVLFQYPVVLFHQKRGKKGNLYYYVFPGISTPIAVHTFASGDPVMNIHNKKLRHDIETELRELLLRYKRDLPIPVSIETLAPANIAQVCKIPKDSECRIFYQDVSAYKIPNPQTPA